MAICLSQYVSDSISKYGRSKSRIRTIHNPQDINNIIENVNLPSRLTINNPYIIASGRLVDQKDYPTLLKAFKKVRDEYKVDLVILGEGPQQNAIIKLIDSLEISNYVHLVGWQDNPYSIMSDAELFVSSSIIEG